MPLEDWVLHSRLDRFLYDWQTVIAGVFALAAGIGTVAAAIWAIRATRSTAREQIDASRKDANRVIAATREQTAVAQKQIDTTVQLELTHDASEGSAFYAMLEAAMGRVVAEVDGARTTFQVAFTQTDEVTVEAGAVRQCITKGAFAELRAAFVRLGSPLTGEFLDLEREIDNFASQVGTHALSAVPIPVRKGRTAGLGDQLAKIERNAKALREKAVERRRNAAKSI
jgi:hypothetical protein